MLQKWKEGEGREGGEGQERRSEGEGERGTEEKEGGTNDSIDFFLGFSEAEGNQKGMTELADVLVLFGERNTTKEGVEGRGR